MKQRSSSNGTVISYANRVMGQVGRVVGGDTRDLGLSVYESGDIWPGTTPAMLEKLNGSVSAQQNYDGFSAVDSQNCGSWRTILFPWCTPWWLLYMIDKSVGNIVKHSYYYLAETTRIGTGLD